MSKYNKKIESSMRIQRSIIVFDQAIKSESTRYQYQYWLKRFIKFHKIKDADSLLTIEVKKLQEMVEDYIFHIKKTFQPNAVSKPMYALSLFFAVNDVTLNWIKIRKFIPKQEAQISGKRAYTNQEVKTLLESAIKPNHKVLILVMASSGVRDQFVEDLKLKHLKEMPHDCLAMTVHSDTVYEYTTFINPEAKEALNKSFEYRKKHGENLNQESPVFATWNAKSMTGMNVSNILSRIARRSLIRKIIFTNPNTNKNRYDVMSSYGLRKRFNTIMKMTEGVNSHIAERMMSHKSKTITLDTSYFSPTVEQSFNEYLKAMPQLFISDSLRLKVELDSKQNKIDDLESLKGRILLLESQRLEIQEHMKNLKV